MSNTSLSLGRRAPGGQIFARASLGLSLMILSLLFCGSQDAGRSTMQAAPARRILRDLPPDGASIQYAGQSLSPEDYVTLKQKEARDFVTQLTAAFGADGKQRFYTKWSKYTLLAVVAPPGRNTDPQAGKVAELERYARAFFEQVYPRYFRYEPRRAFRIVYFRDQRQFASATGSNSYGFFRPGTNTLYTYLNSGHGTLWHELIHAYSYDNAPRSLEDQWFCEGFASFYEMAFLDAQGRVSEGYTNWRLPALQAALRADRVLPLQEALRKYRFTDRFGYAEARFLFLYLWTQGKMEEFVRLYLEQIAPLREPAERSRRSIIALENILGQPIEEIDADYRRLALRVRKNEQLSQSRPAVRSVP